MPNIDWDAIRLEYESNPGITQAELARKHDCSRQAISQHAKAWTKARQLDKSLTDSPLVSSKSGSKLGIRSKDNLAAIVNIYAATGNQRIAANVVGVDRQTLRMWMKEDNELLAQLQQRRASFLAEQYVKIAGAQDWRAAREVLAHAPETKDEWGADRAKDTPTIVLNINRSDVEISGD